MKRDRPSVVRLKVLGFGRRLPAADLGGIPARLFRQARAEPRNPHLLGTTVPQALATPRNAPPTYLPTSAALPPIVQPELRCQPGGS